MFPQCLCQIWLRMRAGEERCAPTRWRKSEELQAAEWRRGRTLPGIGPVTVASWLHVHIGEMQRAKSENMQRLRMQQQYENADLTFRPQVSAGDVHRV